MCISTEIYESLIEGDFVIGGKVLLKYKGNHTAVILPEHIAAIGAYAFYGNSDIESVTIPKNVTVMGECIFLDCDNLTSINVEEDNQNYASIEGDLFNKSITELICYPKCKPDINYLVPKGITKIEKYAFYSCSSLKSVVMQEDVSVIKKGAFKYTSMEITVPSSVISIGRKLLIGATC